MFYSNICGIAILNLLTIGLHVWMCEHVGGCVYEKGLCVYACMSAYIMWVWICVYVHVCVHNSHICGSICACTYCECVCVYVNAWWCLHVGVCVCTNLSVTPCKCNKCHIEPPHLPLNIWWHGCFQLGDKGFLFQWTLEKHAWLLLWYSGKYELYGFCKSIPHHKHLE